MLGDKIKKYRIDNNLTQEEFVVWAVRKYTFIDDLKI